MTNCARAGGCAVFNYPFLTSKERDFETGLDYFGARYYSSTQGRFTSPDEFTGGPDELYYFVDDASDNPTFYGDLTNPQSLNKYQYSYNNPLRYVDPDGHDPQDPKKEPTVDPTVQIATTFVVGTLICGPACGVIAVLIDPPPAGEPNLPHNTGPPNADDFFSERAAALVVPGGSKLEKLRQGGAKAITPPRPLPRRDIEVVHPNRKSAKEAADHPHPGKKKPTPPKSDRKKRKEYEEQRKYDKPETHPNSEHPRPHFHDRDKSKNKKFNPHHVYPR